MPNVPDWRSETAPLTHLERPGFAWEYLRRNRKYIADYERIRRAGNFDKPDVANAAADTARHWGLNCTVRPKTPSYPSNGFLAPRILPTAVILTPAPADFGKAATLDPEMLAAAATESDGAEGLHIRFPGDHQLWLLDKRPDQPLAVVIPLDDDFPLRTASALRLHQLLTDKKVGPPPQSHMLTAQQRKRLILMLLALESHLSKASYREIASALFDASVTSEKGWKTHPIRGRTIRLVKDAMKMVNRGYLKLLRGR